MDKLAKTLVSWHRQHGRHDLPWQKQRNSYRVWISEIMLQQTQVNTVIPYFNTFIKTFPDVTSLANAELDQVLHLWTGLGYYARARNMHRAAVMVRDEWGGQFPDSLEGLISLPGIGRSTAGAILALSLDKPAPILDGNVKRVLTRFHGIHGWPGNKAVENQLWELAIQHTPGKDVATYTQAIMDLGASLCSRSKPDCPACPLEDNCVAFKEDLQQQLPGKKPRKTIPVRQTRFTIVENAAGEVLLEKRPPTGIWGGLWGFPQCDVDQDTCSWLKQHHHIDTEVICEDPPIRHTFSHFHLDITPLRLVLRAELGRIEDKEDRCWYKPQGTQKLGMAAPVKKLMDELYMNTAGEK